MTTETPRDETRDQTRDQTRDLQLLADLGVGVVVVGADLKVIEANSRSEEIFPSSAGFLSKDSVAGMANEILDADEQPVPFEALPVVVAMRTGEPVTGTVLGFRSPQLDVPMVWLLAAAHPERDPESGTVRRVVCSFLDITAQQTALDALVASELRFRELAENAIDMIFRVRVQPTMAFEYVNPAVRSVLGYGPEDFYGDFDLALRVLHSEDRPAVETMFAAAMLEDATAVEPVVARVVRRDGSTVWAQFRAVAVRSGRDVVAFEGIVRDVTSLKAQEALLSFQALHDPLTGLGNRSSLLVALEDAIAQARAGTEGLAVLYVDLDRFKTVNDSFGHPAGDRVLVTLAARLAEGVRPSDHVGRIGGDEFAAVLPSVRDEDGALQVAHRLLDELGTPVPLDDGPLVTTASIGVVFSADGHETPTELLRRADVAMYQAKDRGRARVECWRSLGSARYVEPPTAPRHDEHQG